MPPPPRRLLHTQVVARRLLHTRLRTPLRQSSHPHPPPAKVVKERTFEECKKLVDGILKRDQKRRKKIEAAGIDYECPEILGSNEPAPKKS